MTPVTSPRAAVLSASARTESRDDTSTVAVLTSNPASASTSAAASALRWRRSASTTCLPALTRRAMAWPIWPAPMTTVTSLTDRSFRVVGGTQTQWVQRRASSSSPCRAPAGAAATSHNQLDVASRIARPPRVARERMCPFPTWRRRR